MRFVDRIDAGRVLAQHLRHYAGRPNVLVLGLPRGGVPVAAEVAWVLGAPLDVMLVRKLGVPGREELAMGAISSGGVRVLNTQLLASLDIPVEVVDAVTAAEEVELARREGAYRAGRPQPQIAGKDVLLVDDGLATGATMRAAVEALRTEGPARVVAAAPVGSIEACQMLERVADEVVCAMIPEPFNGVGWWYEDFRQMSDADVREALAHAPFGPPSDVLGQTTDGDPHQI